MARRDKKNAWGYVSDDKRIDKTIESSKKRGMKMTIRGLVRESKKADNAKRALSNRRDNLERYLDRKSERGSATRVMDRIRDNARMQMENESKHALAVSQGLGKALIYRTEEYMNMRKGTGKAGG